MNERSVLTSGFTNAWSQIKQVGLCVIFIYLALGVAADGGPTFNWH